MSLIPAAAADRVIAEVSGQQATLANKVHQQRLEADTIAEGLLQQCHNRADGSPQKQHDEQPGRSQRGHRARYWVNSQSSPM